MPDLEATFLETASRELKNGGIDAWLLYDFRACNALAADLVGLPEGQKRRYFVLIAPGRTPHALVQKIEVSGWDGWPHRLTSYVGWDEMETELSRMLDGMDSVAMEVSPRDSIPYVDNVPAGVVELVESVGPRVVSSVDLISGTAAPVGRPRNRTAPPCGRDPGADGTDRVRTRGPGRGVEPRGRPRDGRRLRDRRPRRPQETEHDSRRVDPGPACAPRA